MKFDAEAMRKCTSLTVIAVLSTLTVFPAAIRFPTIIGRPGSQHDIKFLLVGVILMFASVVVGFAFQQAEEGRKRVLKAMAWLAAVSLGATVLLSLEMLVPAIKIPTPHLLAPLLQVDGEYAYDADVFEIYSEIWLFVAAFFRHYCPDSAA